MSSATSTVSEQKQLFLQARKRELSHGLRASNRLYAIAEDGGIERSVLKSALDKVNRDLKRHAKQSYSHQMTENLVEHIDQLYWETGAREVDGEDGDAATDVMEDTNTIFQSDDLTQDKNISRLPAQWDISTDLPSSRTEEVTQDDYLTSVSRLQDLSARRQTLQNKLNTYRTLLSLLEPYRQPKENIQPNLVWKDSPLAPELSKTRSLAIRVAGRIEERFGDVQVPATMDEDDEDIDMDDLQDERKSKVDKVLANW